MTLLEQNCTEVRFAAGTVLRRKGQHYKDMFLLLHGSAEIDLESTSGEKILVSHCGSPVGEMGFLTGRAASATVTARTDTVALVIDDPTLDLLEREQPQLAAQLLRHLTTVADERTTFNVAWELAGPSSMGARPIEVYLCRSAEMLEEAQRLRYEVYCEELGRQSPYADHAKRTISDQLDRTGQVLVARRGDETIGTLRGNGAWEQELGVYEELYGMKDFEISSRCNRDHHQIHREKKPARGTRGEEADRCPCSVRPRPGQGVLHRLYPAAVAVLPRHRV